MSFYLMIEQTALSEWVRMSTWGFPISLIVHSISLALIAGSNFAIGLRSTGAASRIPLPVLYSLIPLMWFCFFLSLVSGLLLIAAYPAKILTNEVFYVKITLVVVGLALAQKITRDYKRDEFARASRWKGVVLILVWAGVIVTGRLLAYTYDILLVNDLY